VGWRSCRCPLQRDLDAINGALPFAGTRDSARRQANHADPRMGPRRPGKAMSDVLVAGESAWQPMAAKIHQLAAVAAEAE